MTTTVETPVETGPAVEKAQPEGPKYWIVKQESAWQIEEYGLPADYVFEQMPKDDHPTKSAYGSNRLYLYAALRDLNYGAQRGFSKSGRAYIYINPGSAEEHPGPSTALARRNEFLASVADLSIEELRERYATEAERWVDSYWSLHKYADTQGYCPTFDQIMEKTGWPRRPKAYQVVVAVAIPFTLNPEVLQQYVGNAWEVPGFEVRAVKRERVTIATKPLDFRPTTETPLTEMFEGDAIREAFISYYGEERMNDAVWSDVKIIDVRQR